MVTSVFWGFWGRYRSVGLVVRKSWTWGREERDELEVIRILVCFLVCLIVVILEIGFVFRVYFFGVV